MSTRTRAMTIVLAAFLATALAACDSTTDGDTGEGDPDPGVAETEATLPDLPEDTVGG